MSFLPGKENHSFKHLSASTPEELEQLMLKVSIESNFPVNFTAPTYSESKWVTWHNYDWSKHLLESESSKPKKRKSK